MHTHIHTHTHTHTHTYTHTHMYAYIYLPSGVMVNKLGKQTKYWIHFSLGTPYLWACATSKLSLIKKFKKHMHLYSHI